MLLILVVGGPLGLLESRKPVTAARHLEHHCSPDSEPTGGPTYATGRPAVAALHAETPTD